jgi:alpha-L-fucosidase
VPKGIPRKNSVVEHVDPNDKGVLTVPPSPDEFQPWETCMTINNTWGYNKNDKHYKSATVLIRTLIDTVSKGGNFLLNVGPTPEGEIQPEFVERLRTIGAWMKVNGESIYGTTYGPLQELKWGRTTAKGKTVYVHVFDWPTGKLELPNLTAKKVTLLAGKQPLKFTQSAGNVTVELPSQAPDPYATVIAVETR